MSDYNSSLPIRTENNGDVVVKVGDGTIPSQQLAVDSSGKVTAKLNDGAGNSVTSQVNGAQQALDVGINVAGVQVDPRSIRALTAADVITAQQGTSPWTVNGTVTTNQGTSPWITKDQSDGPVAPGTVASFSSLIGGQYNSSLPILTTGQQAAIQVDSSGRLLVTTSTTDDHNYGTVGASTLRTAAQIGNATGAADFNNGATSAQTLRVAANLAIAGANVSVSNPVPVSIADAPGTHINDYKDASTVAASSTDNHDYTVTALKTLHLNQVEASASGKAKMDIQVETGVATGVFTTKWSQFNSTATPNMSIKLDNDILVAAGVRVRIVMTNKDNQPQDLYSTISGFEV